MSSPGSRYDRATVQDAANLVSESPAAPMQIALVGVLATAGRPGTGDTDVSRLRRHVAERVGELHRLRQVLVVPRLGGGLPVWADAPRFAVEEHVVARSLDPPGDESAIRRTCAELASTPLPRDRPLWCLHLLTGAADGDLRVVLRLHHVLADGETAVNLAGVLLGPGTSAGRPAVAAPLPSWPALVLDNASSRAAAVLRAVPRPGRSLRPMGAVLRTVREGVAVTRSAATRRRTSLNVPLRPGRRVAFLDLPLPELRAAAHRYGGTLNDAVLAVVGGGVRALLLHRGEPVDRPVAASVPVSLHTGSADRPQPGPAAGGGGGPANAVGVAVVPLPLCPSAADRLAAVAAGSAAAIRAARRTGPLGLFRSGWVLRAALPLFRRQRLVQLFVTNVRGPRAPLRLGGADLVRAYPLAPLNGNVTLGVGVLSYAGGLGLGLVADRASVPDIDVVVAGIRAAVGELLAGAGQPAS
ncbi:MAG TPA: wax ester/triacylglycerol synthase domain-containing protein [Mycobacteriales bacterium]